VRQSGEHPVHRLRLKMPYGVPMKRFFGDLKHEISNDNVPNGAAALAYYLTLAIFPALLLMLSIVPYLPIAHIDQAIMDLLRQIMPGDASRLLSGTVREVATQRKGGLLSFGVLATLWAAANGTYAVMQQLNITYDVKEQRPFLKARGTAIALTLAVGALMISAFALIVLGGHIQDWLASGLGWGGPIRALFAVLRWGIVFSAFLLAFALTYYYGPDVEQRFRFVSPGAVLGVAILVVASLAFRFYADRFGNYSATYGGIGAVIMMMLWLYIGGLALLLGSEINSLIEHYRPGAKSKGEKREPRAA